MKIIPVFPFILLVVTPVVWYKCITTTALTKLLHKAQLYLRNCSTEEARFNYVFICNTALVLVRNVYASLQYWIARIWSWFQNKHLVSCCCFLGAEFPKFYWICAFLYEATLIQVHSHRYLLLILHPWYFPKYVSAAVVQKICSYKTKKRHHFHSESKYTVKMGSWLLQVTKVSGSSSKVVFLVK